MYKKLSFNIYVTIMMMHIIFITRNIPDHFNYIWNLFYRAFYSRLALVATSRCLRWNTAGSSSPQRRLSRTGITALLRDSTAPIKTLISPSTNHMYMLSQYLCQLILNWLNRYKFSNS